MYLYENMIRNILFKESYHNHIKTARNIECQLYN